MKSQQGLDEHKRKPGPKIHLCVNGSFKVEVKVQLVLERSVPLVSLRLEDLKWVIVSQHW